jgi:hypothetical protein
MPCPYCLPGPWSQAHTASWPRWSCASSRGIGQALPGGLHIPRQRCGRCPQHRRSSPVSGLNGPPGLTLAPNGDLIAVNGSNGNAVEITPSGRQTAKVRLVRRGAGPVFGVTPQAGGHGLLFVNGGVNALDLLSP